MQGSSKPPLPPDDRDRVIAELERHLASELTFEEACHKASKQTRIKWLRQMLSECMDEGAMPGLPMSPNDSDDDEYWDQATVQRTILFLQAGRVYDDGTGPIERLLGSIIGYTLLIGFVLVMGFGLLKELGPPLAWIDLAIHVVMFAFIGAMGVLFIQYAIGLSFAAVHIFRVRVLRQDLRSKLKEDIWPYLDRNEYEKDSNAYADLGEPSTD